MLIPVNVGSVYYYIAVNPKSKPYFGVIRRNLFIHSVSHLHTRFSSANVAGQQPQEDSKYLTIKSDLRLF